MLMDKNAVGQLAENVLKSYLMYIYITYIYRPDKPRNYINLVKKSLYTLAEIIFFTSSEKIECSMVWGRFGRVLYIYTTSVCLLYTFQQT